MPENDPHLRASDADRDQVAERLRAHYAEGRLSAEELDERLEVVYAARTLADLGPPEADLPPQEPAAAPPRPRGRWRRPAIPAGALPVFLTVLAVAGAVALFTGGPSWLLWAAGGWLLFGHWGKGLHGTGHLGCGQHKHGRRRPGRTASA